MTFEEFQATSANGHVKEALDQLVDGFETTFFTLGVAGFNEEQRIIFDVASFVGQMRDGGVKAYLDSPWKACLETLEAGFIRIDLPEYATVAAQIRDVAETADSRDKLEAAENAFWAIFYSSPKGDAHRIDNLLASFACAHSRIFDKVTSVATSDEPPQ